MVKNNGQHTDFHSIKNHAQAAREFAEGNKELEALLLTCFKLRVATSACCAGHNKSNGAYIVFEDALGSGHYLLNMIAGLCRYGYEIRYSFGTDGAKWAFQDDKHTVYEEVNPKMLEQMWNFETVEKNTPTSMFAEMEKIISETDAGHDYMKDLPPDMLKFVQLAAEIKDLKITNQMFLFCYEYDGKSFSYNFNSWGMPEKDAFGKEDYAMGRAYSSSAKRPELAARLLNDFSVQSLIIK